MPTAPLIWLIPGLPLLAFLLDFLLGRDVIGRRSSLNHLIAIACLAASWLLALWTAYAHLSTGIVSNGTLNTWIQAGAFTVAIGYTVDNLTSVMLVVVTMISLLVHIYSVGYMAHEHGGHVERDPGYYRFFSYLPLFTFSMLMLVLADNFLQLYVFWEAVGLCSYLLVGFWYQRQTAAAAAKKAFVVNRVGDFGFGLGVMAVWTVFGTLNYDAVFRAAGNVAPGVLTLICLLLFVGAMGKSAQVPLHTWLPDAMEGPTPVSALIHAATMVTAGVYLVARCYPLYVEAPAALAFVATIGTLTALVAAIIGVTQNDIKRVMAWSTVSQLGYMFFALGVGAPVAAIFHLFTHAFFKALLFLGAGSVMHAMRDETNMQVMGGLGRWLPVTRTTLWFGGLALSGIVPFAGFWSKDAILTGAFASGAYPVWAVGVFAAMLTALYTARMLLLTFHGQPRFDTAQHTPHESPLTMTGPLMVLAGGALIVGALVGFPPEHGLIDAWLGPLFPVHHGAEPDPAQTLLLMLASSVAAGLGLLFAFAAYCWRLAWADPVAWGRRLRPLYLLSYNKFYFDELYDTVFTRPLRAFARGLWAFDAGVIDGAVNGVGETLRGWGGALRGLQTGFTGNYALAMALGAVGMIAAYLLLR